MNGILGKYVLLLFVYTSSDHQSYEIYTPDMRDPRAYMTRQQCEDARNDALVGTPQTRGFLGERDVELKCVPEDSVVR